MDTVVKPEGEWRRELSTEEYHVLRERGTEDAFTGEYWDSHEEGVYHCRGCGTALFDAEAKFDSGTGWPSFSSPVSEEVILEEEDSSHGVIRQEAVCATCGGHLGHVFNDGPEPTGVRYCINSAALQLESE